MEDADLVPQGPLLPDGSFTATESAEIADALALSSINSSSTNSTDNKILLLPPPPPPAVSTTPVMYPSYTGFNSMLSSSTSSFGYSEKKDFAGLSNQGATCYMNSLLQTLFMLPDFRKRLFKWKYNEAVDGESSQCIAFQLQSLFGFLQLGKRGAVATRNLTASFGWTARDSFTQHDVQELNRILFDALELTLKDSEPECARMVKELYEGKMVDQIVCKKCGYTSAHDDPFLDLSLVIRSFDGKTFSSVEESLAAYTVQELMDGGNQYFCSQCQEKVDAMKGLKIKELPKILTLQLKRFDIDWAYERRVKISDYMSFPLVLDMDPYLNNPENPAAAAAAENDQSASADKKKNQYELYSILIHSGGAMGGHYYAYVKDFATGKWFNFNDSSVSEIQPSSIEQMFGEGSGVASKRPGADSNNSENTNNPFASTTATTTTTTTTTSTRSGSSSTNAYMLVYRRIDPEFPQPGITDDDIPQYIRDAVEADNVQFEKERTEYKRVRDALKIKLHHGNINEPLSLIIDTSRETTVAALTKQAHELLRLDEHNIPLDCVRLRYFIAYNNTPQQSYEGEMDKTLGELGLQSQASLYLEVKNPGESFRVISEDEIFLRCVTLDHETLMPKEKDPPIVYISYKSTVEQLKQAIAAKMPGIPADQMRLIDYTGAIALALVPETKLLRDDCHLDNGDVVVVESTVEYPESHVITETQRRRNMITISFNRPGGPPAEFSLQIDKTQQLGTLRQRIAEMLGMSADRIILRRSNFTSYELRNDAEQLVHFALHSDAKLTVEEGKPLQVDECWANFVLYTPTDKPITSSHLGFSTEPLFRIALRESMTIREVKGTVEAKLRELHADSAPERVITADAMRLREVYNCRMNKVWADHKTLKECCSMMGDGREVAVERVAPNTPSLGNEKEIVITCERYHPVDQSFSDRVELVLSPETTMLQLRDVLIDRLRFNDPSTFPLDTTTSSSNAAVADSGDVQITEITGSSSSDSPAQTSSLVSEPISPAPEANAGAALDAGSAGSTALAAGAVPSSSSSPSSASPTPSPSAPASAGELSPDLMKILHVCRPYSVTYIDPSNLERHGVWYTLDPQLAAQASNSTGVAAVSRTQDLSSMGARNLVSYDVETDKIGSHPLNFHDGDIVVVASMYEIERYRQILTAYHQPVAPTISITEIGASSTSSSSSSSSSSANAAVSFFSAIGSTIATTSASSASSSSSSSAATSAYKRPMEAALKIRVNKAANPPPAATTATAATAMAATTTEGETGTK